MGLERRLSFLPLAIANLKSLGLDPETVIDETISHLQDENTSLDSYNFCVIGLKNDAQSRIQRQKLNQPSDSVPYPERQLLVSKSSELRQILRSLLNDYIPLHSGAFSGRRIAEFLLICQLISQSQPPEPVSTLCSPARHEALLAVCE